MPLADSPTTEPADAVLVVGTVAHRKWIVAAVGAMGIASAETDDPYAAMAELCRRPQRYRAVVLSLQGVYREELPVIAAVHRLAARTGGTPVEVWLADLDGRAVALAEAMRLGVDALLVEDGLHRVGTADPAATGAGAAEAKPLRANGTEPARAAGLNAYLPGRSSVGGGGVAVVGDAAPAADAPARRNEVADYLNLHAANQRPAEQELSPWHEIASGNGGGGSAGGGIAPSRTPAGPTTAVSVDVSRPAVAPAGLMADYPDDDVDPMPGEPVLTAEELRALLQDQPDLPPG